MFFDVFTQIARIFEYDYFGNVLVRPAKARQRSRSVRNRDVTLAEVETGARNTSNGDHRDDRLQRDVVSCDRDEESGPWVPYVYFGV
jgi:hypothetical protein